MSRTFAVATAERIPAKAAVWSATESGRQRLRRNLNDGMLNAIMPERDNIDTTVVESFGREWKKFDHAHASAPHLQKGFESYFGIFDWSALPPDARGFDMGCGSGRWARLVAPRVGELTCVDPSETALAVARQNLGECSNCRFVAGTADANPLPDDGFDFGYSLGVLHHVPDTARALQGCVAKVKPGGQFLVYLYYRFDGRPAWFRALWKISDAGRRVISRLPFGLRSVVCELISALIYWPLARFARQMERLGMKVENFPLANYRDYPYYAMRTDALDRFGTRLEKRFTKTEIEAMMAAAGLTNIRFSDSPPFWCAVGTKSL